MSTIGASDWFKKATHFGYARISTDKQSADDKRQMDVKKKKTIVRQMKQVNDALKLQGLPQVKPENWFVEVASGRKRDRTEWMKLRAAALAHDGQAFVVVKDPSRWARNTNAAVIAWDELMQKEVPVYAVIDGIQTGTNKDVRPQEALMFLLTSGFGAFVSDVQGKKSDAGVVRQREEGAMAGKGTSLFPFARRDPLMVYRENTDMLSRPRGGKTALKNAIGDLSMPDGMKATSANNLLQREEARQEKLIPSKYKEWLDFRQLMRERLIRLDSDPWAGGGNSQGKLDYKANALLRMSGNYLKSPWLYPQPTQAFLDDVELNFAEYISDKDTKRRGKRRV